MRKKWLIGVLVALALVAGACGGDDDDEDVADDAKEEVAEDESDSEDNGGATDTGVTATEVKVAIVSEKSGSQTASSNGIGFDDGFESYIEEVNEDGGVHGRKIVVVAEHDDNGDVNKNQALIERAFNQDKAFTAVGCFSKLGGVNYLQQNKQPFIGCNHDGPNWEKTEYALGIGGNWFDKTPGDDPPSQPNANVAYVMAKLGVKKLGVFSYQHPGSKSASENVCKWAKSLYGQECVYEDYSLQFGFTDIGASVQKLKDSGVEFIYGGMDSGGALTVIRSLKRAGLNIPSMWAIIPSQEEAAKSPELIGDYFGVQAYPPFDGDSPEMKKLVATVKKRKPGVEMSNPVTQGWAAGKLLVDGLEKAGPKLTKDGFYKAIRSMNAFNSGVGATVDFTKSPEEKVREGIKPDPNQCSGVLMRGDTQAKKMVQVGEKPILCLAGIESAAALKAKVDKDKSNSLAVKK